MGTQVDPIFHFHQVIIFKQRYMLTTVKRINQYSFRLNDKIGDGCSSEVYTGQHQKTHQRVAIKIIPKIQHSRAENIKIAQNEIKCLHELKGLPNLLQLCYSSHTKNNIYIITDLCQKGTLADWLCTNGKLSEEQALLFLKQIINAYRGLTQKGIIHRDLKPTNIFVTQQEKIVLGDFGFAVQLQNSQETFVGSAGSPYYMAPEVLSQKIHSSKSDIWAIGMIFLEMLHGATPWKSKTQHDLKMQMERFDPIKYIPEHVSTQSRVFLARTLTKQVTNRMSVEELLSFSFSGASEGVNPKKVSGSLIKTNSISTDASDKSANYEEANSFSEVKKKTNAKSSVFKLISKDTSLIFREQQSKTYVQPEGKDSKPMKKIKASQEIALQIQTQITFFRFVFKIYKKIKQTIRSNQEAINSLSQHLLYLVYNIITETKDLTRLTGFTTTDIHEFRSSKQYQQAVRVLESYKERYVKQQQKNQTNCKYQGDGHFLYLLNSSIELFYQSIVSIEGNQNQLNRKRALIFLTEDLLMLKEVFLMSKQNYRNIFAIKNELKQAMQRQVPPFVEPAYWQKVKAKCKQTSASEIRIQD